MEYKLEFRPTERKPGMKYRTILLTDITLHTSQKRPSTFGEKMKKAFNAFGIPGRAYQPMSKPELKKENPGAFKMGILNHLQNDPEFIKYVTEEREKGVEIVIQIPKAGVPVLAGEDTVEFINSIKGKRILRRLAKEKSEGV